MLFNKKFTVVAIIESKDMRCTYQLEGKRKDVNEDIEKFKKKAIEYEMVGKDGMIVWL